MKNLSPSKSKKGITDGQIGKLKGMLEHGINKLTVFQDTPTAEVDRFIKKVGPSLRDVWVELLVKRFRDFIDTELLEKRFQNFIGIFQIPVDYDELGAIAKAIEANKLDWKHTGLAEIPLVGDGRAIWEVHEVSFGRVMYNCDLPNALKQRGEELGYKGGFKFVDPLTALRFTWANPDRQRKHPLAILFTDQNGRLYSLCLLGASDQRSLNIHQASSNDYWLKDTRFLAVCKPPAI